MKRKISYFRTGFCMFLLTIFAFNSSIGKGLQPGLTPDYPISCDTVPAIEKADSSHDYTEALFPGGNKAWMMHLMRSLRYPREATDKRIQGTVIVKFLVDEQGNIDNFEVLTGPKQLHNEAIRVIRAGGKWIPASDKGKPILSAKEQTITFRLEQ